LHGDEVQSLVVGARRSFALGHELFSDCSVPEGRFCMRSRLLFYLFLTWAVLGNAFAQSSGELRFSLHADPKTFNPLQAADEASETVRYLTGGVLIRVNRKTQAFEPGLAVSWKIFDAGRKISFELRQGVSFSDGTPF